MSVLFLLFSFSFVEGGRRFRVRDAGVQKDELLVADVQWPVDALRRFGALPFICTAWHRGIDYGVEDSGGTSCSSCSGERPCDAADGSCHEHHGHDRQGRENGRAAGDNQLG